MINLNELFPYKFNKKYSKPAAYFSMEFAVDQPLKIYSGGLGFLAGSHLRSAYELKQNLIGIGILWKKGYYDQERNQDQTLRVSFRIRTTLFDGHPYCFPHHHSWFESFCKSLSAET